MKQTYYTLFGIILIILVCVDLSNNASLDIQNKYQKFIGDQGLYVQKDDVEILTVNNFKNAVVNSKRAWLVEFYNSWCGFCQRFAPSWKEFATDVRGWKDLVVVAAFDCSNEDNYPLCRDYEIMAYPTIRYYHEGFKEEPKSYGFAMNRGGSADEHRQDLVKKIVNEQQEGRGQHFPNLLPYSAPDTSQIFANSPAEVTYAVLIIQEPGVVLGPEVILDLHRTSSIVTQYALSNNTELVKQLGVTSFPALYIVKRDFTASLVKTTTNNRQGFREAAKEYLKLRDIYIAQEEMGEMGQDQFESKKEINSLMERVKKMGDVVFQMDLESALRYSLKREVGGAKEISGEKLDALRKYLQVLAKFFPFGRNGKTLLAEISNYANENSLVQGQHIAKLVKEAEKEDRKVFSTPQKWLGCQGSSAQYRGYPCGLWKMFHYLTVNVADYEQGVRGDNPRLALEAMHGYIKHFFGCAECSQHFQDMAKRREIDKVDSFDESILWLWMAHNEVNKRLSGDETEDPDFPKIQFPSERGCPKCHKPDGQWEYGEVLKYLKHMYSTINVRYIGADSKILHLGLEGSNTSTEGLQEKDVQVQIRPVGESIMDGSVSSLSSSASTKDKTNFMLPLIVLPILYVKIIRIEEGDFVLGRLY